MRKLIFTILILNTWANFSTGQNLVPNPSFEIHDTCPSDIGMTSKAIPWLRATSGSSDYYNACATGWHADVPKNYLGFEYARTGDAYVGLYTKYPSYREYVCAPLVSPLLAGRTYYASMYVSLSVIFGACTPSDRIGMYFSIGYPDTSGVITSGLLSGNIPKIPQVENPSGNLLSDTLNWMRVSGSFTAVGGENYITIGNFRNDLMTMGTSQSYYFVDDVCISTDSMTCAQGTGISDYKSLVNFKLYPNPTNQFATLEFNNSKKQNCTLTLYDLRGQAVQTIKNITADKVEIDRQSLASGLYFFQLRTDRQIIATGKLTIE